MLVLNGQLQCYAENERALLLADNTERGSRGNALGSYQFWTSVSAGFAVIIGGYLIDWLTINVLFYTSAVFYGISAWAVTRSNEKTQVKSLNIT